MKERMSLNLPAALPIDCHAYLEEGMIKYQLTVKIGRIFFKKIFIGALLFT
jgi:hypothetical protein